MEIAPVNTVIDYAHRMGITSPLPHVESLALGSGDVSPLEMTSAFGVFANHGVYVEPNSILRIEDKDGNVIEENMPQRREVLSEETSFIMTSMMQGVVDEGTGVLCGATSISLPRGKPARRTNSPMPGSWDIHRRFQQVCGWDSTTRVFISRIGMAREVGLLLQSGDGS